VTPNCHAACERYLAFDAERKRYNEARLVESCVTGARLAGQKKHKNEYIKHKKGR
jgi:hypothetical protein